MGSGLSRDFKSAALGIIIIAAVTYWKRKQKTIEDLKKQLNAASATLGLLQSQLDQTDSESTAREQKIQELINENGSVKNVIAELKEKIVMLKEQAEALKSRKEALYDELSSEKKHMSDLKRMDEEKIQELTAANKKASEDLEHLIVQHEQKENEIQCLTLTLTQIRNEMSRMIEKNEEEERERKSIFARKLADLVAKEKAIVKPVPLPCPADPVLNNNTNSTEVNGKKKKRRHRKKPNQMVTGIENVCGNTCHE